MNILMDTLPFFALGILGIATFVAALGARSSALRSERLGEDRFELLREQQERFELLREERKVLVVELERERRERVEAQERVKRLSREHPHLELEREVQRLGEELELEREGRIHNHSERQRLCEELEGERLARSRALRDRDRLNQKVQELERLLEVQQESREDDKKGLWASLFRTNSS